MALQWSDEIKLKITATYHLSLLSQSVIDYAFYVVRKIGKIVNNL